MVSPQILCFSNLPVNFFRGVKPGPWRGTWNRCALGHASQSRAFKPDVTCHPRDRDKHGRKRHEKSNHQQAHDSERGSLHPAQALPIHCAAGKNLRDAENRHACPKTRTSGSMPAALIGASEGKNTRWALRAFQGLSAFRRFAVSHARYGALAASTPSTRNSGVW